MSEIRVKDLAKLVKTSVEDLIEKLSDAGSVKESAEDIVSEEEKMQLINYLRESSGSARTVVQRRTIEQKGAKGKVVGKSGTVNIEVRKKRTYAKKRSLEEKQEEVSETAETAETGAKQTEPLTSVPATDELPAGKSDDSPSATVTSAPEEESKPVKKGRKTPLSKEAKPATVIKPRPETAPEQIVPEISDPKKVSSDTNQKKTDKKRQSSDRRELHVTEGKRGQRKLDKKKSRRTKVVPIDKHKFEMPTKPIKREVEVYENIAIKDLAQGLAIKSAELTKQMFSMGLMGTINQALDQDTATLIVEEMGHIAKPIKESSAEDILIPIEDVSGEPTPRPPVVTVMGHVDHGKTSLLDYIRESQVATNEQGGITQHIGAYCVSTKKGDITFLDTPGHEAFTVMRARGAQFTDIIVLVVAADDGVMPQTEEAIQHAKTAQAPLVVAINKIDKPEADIEKIKNDLSQREIISEQWGGDTIFVEVSAKTGAGVEDLLEAILLQAEVMELKAVAEGGASGVVIESSLDKGRGAVATVLVQQGCLKKGDILIVGKEYSRVRMLFDENNKPLKQATPSVPALVLGLSGVPEAGDKAVVVKSERQAKEVVEFRRRKDREAKLAGQLNLTSAESFLSEAQGNVTVLKVLLKTDVQGSMEAIKDALMKLANEEVKAEIVATGIGAITESDIGLASASGAIIIGFNVRTDTRARKSLQGTYDVPVRYYSIIYEVIDDVKQMLSGMLEPEIREEIIGTAEVKDVFRSSKFGAVAGCQIVEGTVKRGKPIRVLRGNVVIYEGELESLRRFKDEVDKVVSGTECGIAVKNYNDVKVGDSIEVYERTEVKRTLES